MRSAGSDWVRPVRNPHQEDWGEDEQTLAWEGECGNGVGHWMAEGTLATVEEDHRQPAEQGYPLSARKTYRYLRIGMLVVVLTLGYSVLQERRASGCWLGSISGYYYTPVGPVFVGMMVAVALALVVIKGRMVEDVFLTLAGFMAPVVAFLPTTDPTLGANYPSFEAHASPGRGRSSTTALTPGQGSSPVPRGTTCTRWPLPAQSGSSWSSPRTCSPSGGDGAEAGTRHQS